MRYEKKYTVTSWHMAWLMYSSVSTFCNLFIFCESFKVSWICWAFPKEIKLRSFSSQKTCTLLRQRGLWRNRLMTGLFKFILMLEGHETSHCSLYVICFWSGWFSAEIMDFLSSFCSCNYGIVPINYNYHFGQLGLLPAVMLHHDNRELGTALNCSVMVGLISNLFPCWFATCSTSCKA